MPTTRPQWIAAPTFGTVTRMSDSDSRLVAFAHDADGDESTALTLTCGIADPDDELAAMRAVVDLCNNRATIAEALRAAEKVLDSVPHVSTPGDTARPLRLVRAALAALILSGCGGGGDAPAAEPQTIAERGGAVVSLGGLPAGGHP